MAGRYHFEVMSSEQTTALVRDARDASSLQAAAREAVRQANLYRSGNKHEVITITVKRVG